MAKKTLFEGKSQKFRIKICKFHKSTKFFYRKHLFLKCLFIYIKNDSNYCRGVIPRMLLASGIISMLKRSSSHNMCGLRAYKYVDRNRSTSYSQQKVAFSGNLEILPRFLKKNSIFFTTDYGYQIHLFSLE